MGIKDMIEDELNVHRTDQKSVAFEKEQEAEKQLQKKETGIGKQLGKTSVEMAKQILQAKETGYYVGAQDRQEKTIETTRDEADKLRVGTGRRPDLEDRAKKVIYHAEQVNNVAQQDKAKAKARDQEADL